jgi:hypothetical protein
MSGESSCLVEVLPPAGLKLCFSLPGPGPGPGADLTNTFESNTCMFSTLVQMYPTRQPFNSCVLSQSLWSFNQRLTRSTPLDSQLWFEIIKLGNQTNSFDCWHNPSRLVISSIFAAYLTACAHQNRRRRLTQSPRSTHPAFGCNHLWSWA